MSGQDFITLMDAVLRAGTWTNYGSTPGIYSMHPTGSRRSREKVRGKKDTRIILENLDDAVDLTFDGTVIYTAPSGIIRIETLLDADQANLELDLRAILKASQYPFTIRGINRRDLHQKRREIGYRVELIA